MTANKQLVIEYSYKDIQFGFVGKGTQRDRITKMYDYVHVPVGDLLQEEADKPDSNLGKEINEHMKNACLVSAQITCKLLENGMQKSDKKRFLIDGFSRNKDNVDGWKETMDDGINIECVHVFDCDEKISIGRCLERGKEGSGRTDDNKESLKKRIATYNESTRPIIQLYEKENLVKQIDASNDVFEDVQNVMKNFK